MCEVRDLKPNGANVLVTEENKKEYVHLVCQMRMTGEAGVRVGGGRLGVLLVQSPPLNVPRCPPVPRGHPEAAGRLPGGFL